MIPLTLAAAIARAPSSTGRRARISRSSSSPSCLPPVTVFGSRSSGVSGDLESLLFPLIHGALW